MPSTPFCTMSFASLLLTVTLIPLPISARPVSPFALVARQSVSATMDHDVIFDIAFFLVLFIALLCCFAWLASRRTARPAEFVNRLGAAFSRQLSIFGRPAFIERVSTTNLDTTNANTAFVPRRGGASYPVATVPWGLQGGGPRRVGDARGSGDRPASIPSIHAVV